MSLSWFANLKTFIGEVACQPEKGAFAYNAYNIKKEPYNIILFYIVMPSRWQQITVFMIESLTYSLNQFIRKQWFISKWNK